MASDDGKTVDVSVCPSEGQFLLLKIGKLKWKQYKRLKSLVIATLAKDASALMAAFSAGIDGDFGKVAQVIADTVGDLDTLYAQGCLVDPPKELDFDALSFEDVSALVTAATTLNPVAEILAHEKNSASGGLVLSLLKTVNSLPGSSLAGGSFLNQFSQGNMGGQTGS